MITQLEISNLFGLYSYKLDFRCEIGDAISIITGPNGYGKTSVLRLINALYTRDYDALFNIPFDVVKYHFDNKILKVKQKKVMNSEAEGSDLQQLTPLQLILEFYNAPSSKKCDVKLVINKGEDYGLDNMDAFNLFMNTRGCYYISDNRIVSYKTDVKTDRLSLEHDLLEQDVKIFKDLLDEVKYDAKNEENLDKAFKERLDMFRWIIDSCHFADKSMQISRMYGIRFKLKNNLEQFIDIQKLSSGEKHLLIQALELIFLAKDGMVTMIDEPELSFHPAWLNQYVSNIEKIQQLKSTQDNQFQVIIATHSPQLIGQRWNKCIDLYKQRIK